MAGADGSAQADAARAKLVALERALVVEIRRLLEQLHAGAGGELAGDQQAIATASHVHDQVLELLAARGAVPVHDIAEQGAIEAAAAVAETTPLGDFTPAMAATVEGVVGSMLDGVTGSFTEAADAIGEAMRQGITTGGSLSELTAEVARIVETTVLRAQAAVDAAIMGAGRAIALEAAAEASRGGGPGYKFKYVGPLDGKTRPFCAEIVGKTFTRAEIDAMDNDTDLPVAEFGGGYNCRHSWAPVVDDGEGE